MGKIAEMRKKMLLKKAEAARLKKEQLNKTLDTSMELAKQGINPENFLLATRGAVKVGLKKEKLNKAQQAKRLGQRVEELKRVSPEEYERVKQELMRIRARKRRKIGR